MRKSREKTGIVEDPKRLLLELAGHHHLTELLPLAAGRLAESPAVALVRIWLVQPPLPGDCATCRLATECQNRERCLHLVASAGRSRGGALTTRVRADSAFRRFPIGLRKVGRIAKTGESLEVANVARDHTWVAWEGRVVADTRLTHA